MVVMTQIGNCKHKGKFVVLECDQYGHWFITVDGTVTQKRLNATEMAEWFLNALNETR